MIDQLLHIQECQTFRDLIMQAGKRAKIVIVRKWNTATLKRLEKNWSIYRTISGHELCCRSN